MDWPSLADNFVTKEVLCITFGFHCPFAWLETIHLARYRVAANGTVGREEER
jgi:hypothetical protein